MAWVLALVAFAAACNKPPLGSKPPASPPAFDPNRKVVFEERSPFGMIYVIDEGDRRYLRFDTTDGDDQSMISLSDPNSVPMGYIRVATVGLAYANATPGRILMLGLGGGTFSTLLHRVLPEATIEIAEINPSIVWIAKQFFGVVDDERVDIRVTDGKKHLERTSDTFELIFLDAYSGAGIPEHLTSVEFFSLVRSCLSGEGVVVLNLSLDAEEERRLLVTFRRVFNGADCYRSKDTVNLLVVSRWGPRPDGMVLAHAQALNKDLALPFDLAEIAKTVDVGCAEALGPRE